MENGATTMIVAEIGGDLEITVGRIVFDAAILPEAFALYERRHELRLPHKGNEPEFAEIGWTGGRIEGQTFLAISYVFQRASAERGDHEEQLVEAIYDRPEWRFQETDDEDGFLIRKPVRPKIREQIERYYFPLYVDGVPRRHVSWDIAGDIPLSWTGLHPKVVNRYGRARGRFVVEWSGRDYKGASVGRLENMLAVPGLGPLCIGDFRRSVADEEREMNDRALEIIVPSKKLVLRNEDLSLEFVRTIRD
jgi:hypothetical protein